MASASAAARMTSRMQRELRVLEARPPPGVAAWPVQDNGGGGGGGGGDLKLNHLHAQLQGPAGTPYEKGVFRLDVRIPDNYPIEPPKVRFLTPVYHPNIDSGGRICLDMLNMPPKGSWTPRLEISAVLASVGVLLAEPNPDDGLMADIVGRCEGRCERCGAARRLVIGGECGGGGGGGADEAVPDGPRAVRRRCAARHARARHRRGRRWGKRCRRRRLRAAGRGG